MSGKERADLGFADALEDFNPAEWAPRAAPSPKPRIEKAGTRKAAAAAGFRSREPRPEPEAERLQPEAERPQSESPGPEADRAGEAPVRRRRTGRNTQLNLKARPETIAAFCAIADLKGWGLGETLEYAVDLLEREYKSR